MKNPEIEKMRSDLNEYYQFVRICKSCKLKYGTETEYEAVKGICPVCIKSGRLNRIINLKKSQPYASNEEIKLFIRREG